MHFCFYFIDRQLAVLQHRKLNQHLALSKTHRGHIDMQSTHPNYMHTTHKRPPRLSRPPRRQKGRLVMAGDAAPHPLREKTHRGRLVMTCVAVSPLPLHETLRDNGR